MIKVLDLLPGELVPTEMTSGSSVLVDGLLQVEVFDEHSRTQVEVVDDDALQVSISVS